MTALLALGARDLTAFKDMNSTDFSMRNDYCGGIEGRSASQARTADVPMEMASIYR